MNTTTGQRIAWNTGCWYAEEGQVIYAELGWYPARPELVAMYDISRSILYVYDLSDVVDPENRFPLSKYALQTAVMRRYLNNMPEANVDYSDSDYYPALNQWRQEIASIPAESWPKNPREV